MNSFGIEGNLNTKWVHEVAHVVQGNSPWYQEPVDHVNSTTAKSLPSVLEVLQFSWKCERMRHSDILNGFSFFFLLFSGLVGNAEKN